MRRLLLLAALLAAPGWGLELQVRQGPGAASEGALLCPITCLDTQPQGWLAWRDEVPAAAPRTLPVPIDARCEGPVLLLIQRRDDVTLWTDTNPATAATNSPSVDTLRSRGNAILRMAAARASKSRSTSGGHSPRSRSRVSPHRSVPLAARSSRTARLYQWCGERVSTIVPGSSVLIRLFPASRGVCRLLSGATPGVASASSSTPHCSGGSSLALDPTSPHHANTGLPTSCRGHQSSSVAPPTEPSPQQLRIADRRSQGEDQAPPPIGI